MSSTTDSFGQCPCGHPWLRHDVEEYRGDGSETCCVEGCDQSGCPGRVLVGAVLSPRPGWRPANPDEDETPGQLTPEA